ncbi:rRNA-binding ribosome biosynthesis protein rpf2 [Tritrichomonas musculus]|uniref:Ribosome production factor 2 homolog n=1 Tax=Tritrichomonas musculus TaxID=1915356 RepID=A0ABR2HD16_9EUKA
MSTASTHKGKRFLEEHGAKIQENRKKSLFIKGRKVSQDLNTFFEELAKFRYNEMVRYTKANDINPFEDYSEIEKYCKKNYCSLFTFFNSNYRRPMNVIFGRLFDYVMLEMYEFGVANFKTSKELPKADIEPGTVPALIFQGDLWETEYKPIRSMFMDFFVNDLKGTISEEQIQHALVFTIVENEVAVAEAPEQGNDEAVETTEEKTELSSKEKKKAKKKANIDFVSIAPILIRVRHYQVEQNKNGAGAVLNLVAPSFDLVPRRKMDPDETLMERALEKPKFDKKKKNITKNELGEIHGRVFTPKQKTEKIIPRKFKGLPKTKYERPAEPADDAL